MKLHANAALSLNRRRLLCRRVLEEDWTLTKAALVAEVSVRCARTWVGRYRAEGELGLLDRSSAPLSIPHRTSEQRVEAIAALRRLRFTGPEIAETLDMALSTVSGILTRIEMGKLGRLGFEPARRYLARRGRANALRRQRYTLSPVSIVARLGCETEGSTWRGGRPRGARDVGGVIGGRLGRGRAGVDRADDQVCEHPAGLCRRLRPAG